MTRRRGAPKSADSQSAFTWPDAAHVLEQAPDGEVLYEAPELRPRARPRPAPPAATVGLPFGVRAADGRNVCWSCGHDVDEDRVVRAGPGDSRCPGCGAKLPFY